MNLRLIAIVAAALAFGVGTGCKTQRTTTPKRSSDPILSKFASNFNVGEDGYMVSDERSEYENREVTTTRASGEKQFEARVATMKAFEGSEEHKTGLFSGGKRKAFDGATLSYETSTSALGDERSREGNMDAVRGGTYDTRTDAITGGTYKTGENRMVKDRVDKTPDPYIIDSGADEVSVDEVRRMLEKD